MKNNRLIKILALLMMLALLSAAIVATAITAQAAAPSTYTDIALDSAQSISVSGNGRYYRFIPAVGGTYEISSYSCTSGDPYVYLLDANGNTITYNDDGNGNLNFKITYRLEAGVTYYINARSYGNSSYYTFKITAVELDQVILPDLNFSENSVLVIMDEEPWDKNSISVMMNRLKNDGFITNWDTVSTSSVNIDVMSNYNVVYVAGDQDSYAQSRIKNLKSTFEQYVSRGGVLVYSFLTMNSSSEYRNNLPGGVTSRYGSNRNNKIVDWTHPIITRELSEGTSLTNDDMTGSSASHDYIDSSTLPANSRIIVTTSDNKPTLVEYPLGDGTVIATGMTWEFYAQTSYGEGGFARNAYDDLFLYALSISTANCEHEFVEGDYVEPTCTEQGYTAYNCTICGAIDKRDLVPQLGHLTSGWIIDCDATCELSGTKHTVCERCGEYLENVYIPALGHNYTSVVTRESTCTQPGIITYTCQNCFATYNTYVYSEHRYSLSEHADASCVTDGYDRFACSLCSDSYTNVIPGGHNYVAVVTRVATEEEEGIITYTCEHCYDSYEETVPTRPDASVLLIQDRIPWSKNANVELLNALVSGEYISGWDMVTTDEFDASILASYKVVMIANDQTTATYERLAEITESLTSFAEAGGVVIYGACDRGWAGGTIQASLPLGVTKENYYSRYNYIADNNHKIVLASYTNGDRLTEELLSGNYCSHSYFNADTLPEGAKIILQDGQGNPTLVEYAVGEGYVIASGLTWEFYYSYGNENYSKSIFDDLVVYATYLTDTCEHIFDVGEWVSPTCAQAGHMLHTCMNCGMTMKDNFDGILSHTEGEMLTVIEATDSREGRKESHCTACGELIGWEIIPKLNAPSVLIYPLNSITVGQEVVFRVYVQNGGYGTNMQIIPRFDASVFEYVGGEWLLYGDGTVDPDTMMASISYEYEEYLGSDVYQFTLRAKVPVNEANVSASVTIISGGQTVDNTVIGSTVATEPCDHYVGTGIMIDENTHLFTCDLCGYGEVREHRYSDDYDVCCNDGCGYHRGLYGDLDGNGVVEGEDAFWLFDYIYNYYWDMPESFDIDGTGYINEYDAYTLLMYVFFPDTLALCDCDEYVIRSRAAAREKDAAVADEDIIHRGDCINYINPSNSSNFAKFGAFEIVYDENVMELVDMYWDLPGADYNEIIYRVNNKLVFAYRYEREIRTNAVWADLRAADSCDYGITTVGINTRMRGDNSLFISDQSSEKNIFISCYSHSFVENVSDEFIITPATCESRAVYCRSCSECGYHDSVTFEYGELAEHDWVNKDGSNVCSICNTIQSDGANGGSGSTKPDKDKGNGENGANDEETTGASLGMTGIVMIAGAVIVVIIIIIIIVAASARKKKKLAALAASDDGESVGDESTDTSAECGAENAVETEQTPIEESAPQQTTAAQQAYAPQYNAGQGYAPQYNAGQGYAPQYNAGQGYAPQYNNGQGYAPQYNNGQAYAPQYNNGQGYAPQYNAGQSADGENAQK